MFLNRRYEHKEHRKSWHRRYPNVGLNPQRTSMKLKPALIFIVSGFCIDFVGALLKIQPAPLAQAVRLCHIANYNLIQLILSPDSYRVRKNPLHYYISNLLLLLRILLVTDSYVYNLIFYQTSPRF